MKLPLLSILSKDEQKLVQGFAIEKDKIIHHEGEVCEKIGIVVSGKVDIVSYTNEGQEVLINSLLPGDIYGNNLLFSSEPIYRGFVIAKEKSVIAFINEKNLIFLLQNNQEFMLRYLKIQSDFGKRLKFRIQLLSFVNAEDRLFFYAKQSNNVITYKNVTSLASIIGVQRETLSRLLTSLISRHLIKKEKNRIIILNKKH